MTRAVVAAAVALALAGCVGGVIDNPGGGDACGIPDGARCADATTLEQCAGTEVETVDCAAAGQVCTVGAGGAACAGDGDACGDVTEAGACAGDVLSVCVDDALAVTDCADGGMTCGWSDAAAANVCDTACAFAGVDDVGRCAGDGAFERCADGRVETTACGAGERCFHGPAGPSCLAQADACDGIGPVGVCSGDWLIVCGGDGWPQATDCAAAGQVCAYAGDAAGYQCADPATVGARVVTGTVLYEDRYPVPGALGAPTPRPARSARVAVVRDVDDQTLAVAAVSDDGSYTLRYDADDGASVRVTAATSSQIPARPIRVERNSGAVHGFSGASFPAAPSAVSDLLLPADDGVTRAFNVFDVLVDGMIFTASLGSTSFSPVTAVYQAGSNTGSYYTSNDNTLVIAGGSDDDGYDDTVILHEFGHYHQDEYGWSDSPGGSHPNPGGDDPRLAWGEGQATAIACAIRQVPAYIDYSGGGGWSVELETTVHAANPGGSMNQYIYEWLVAEIMWDAGDDGYDEDGDPVAGIHHDVHAVTTTYFYDPAYVGRGSSGVDMVDWLDGYLWRMGAEACDAARALVTDWHGFPYDFSGPVSCP